MAKLYQAVAKPYQGITWNISASSIETALTKLRRCVRKMQKQEYNRSAYEPVSIQLKDDELIGV